MIPNMRVVHVTDLIDSTTLSSNTNLDMETLESKVKGKIVAGQIIHNITANTNVSTLTFYARAKQYSGGYSALDTTSLSGGATGLLSQPIPNAGYPSGSSPMDLFPCCGAQGLNILVTGTWEGSITLNSFGSFLVV